MGTLQKTLFVLGMLILATQTFRHVYVKWFEPKASVLDEFREPVEKDIAESKDLADLKARYAKAHAALKASEAEKSLERIDLERRTDRSVYKEEEELRAAIERVEGHERSLFELWFFWLCGAGSIGVGILAYAKVNRWVGMVGMITGFLEMAWWTSPLWRSRGPQGTFDRLLSLKLGLSAVSLGLLLALWLWSQRERRVASA